MPTRNVVITDRQAKLIERLVAEGRYQNASEVLRDGLRLLEERDKEQAAKLRALREAIQVGIDASERGDYTTFDSAKDLTDYLRNKSVRAMRTRRSR